MIINTQGFLTKCSSAISTKTEKNLLALPGIFGRCFLQALLIECLSDNLDNHFTSCFNLLCIHSEFFLSII